MAPSTMPEELPAWWTCSMRSSSGYFSFATLSKPGIIVPIASKAARRAPSDCMSVPGRGYSSFERIGRPFWSRTVITDLSKRPSAIAWAARFWDSTA